MQVFDTIIIPVSPHVQKFMSIAFGSNYLISRNDPIGIMIMAMLSKKINGLDFSENTKKSTYYPISISENIFNKEGYWIDDFQKRMIGKTFDLYFREIMYSHAILNKEVNEIQYKKSIISFCESFNITPDDIDYETLYKDFRRKKEDGKRNMIANLNENITKKQTMSVL